MTELAIPAQTLLGGLYYTGEGVPKDDVQSYAWMNIGVAQTGNEESRELLEIITREMTTAGITKA